MKSISDERKYLADESGKIRFIAVSASFPNIEDIGDWIDKQNAKVFRYVNDYFQL